MWQTAEGLTDSRETCRCRSSSSHRRLHRSDGFKLSWLECLQLENRLENFFCALSATDNAGSAREEVMISDGTFGTDKPVRGAIMSLRIDHWHAGKQ